MNSKAITVEYQEKSLLVTFQDQTITFQFGSHLAQAICDKAAQIANLEQMILEKLKWIKDDAERAIQKHESGYAWNLLGEMQSAPREVDLLISRHGQAIDGFKALWWVAQDAD